MQHFTSLFGIENRVVLAVDKSRLNENFVQDLGGQRIYEDL